MKKIKPATIEAGIQTELDAINIADRSKNWDKSRRNCIKRFKASILLHGMQEQNEQCVWCTLTIGEAGRRTAHRDHIAPKGIYPQWTFVAKNLVLACEYCNGFSVKNDLDTVATAGITYDQTTFKIIHPYIDTPSDHIEFVDQVDKVLIQGISDKGKWTIENMKLDSSGLTTLRAKDLVFSRVIQNIPEEDALLLKQATGRV